jgi:hypothetical protein
MHAQRLAWSAGALAVVLASGARASAVSTEGYGEVFPGDNPWNIDITHFPLHANSANFVATNTPTGSLHPDFGTVYAGAPWGIPFDVVPGTQPKVVMTFVNYPAESDPGPYPYPADCPIEGGPSAPSNSDRHTCVIDKDHHVLYELYNAFPQPDGSWQSSNGAVFDLTSNAMRPAGWTSADAAGLPVFAGLARYDEVASGAIHHALRFTFQHSQASYLYPARHFAASLPVPDPTPANIAPMGLRFRLHANADLSQLSPQAHIIAVALQHYGMIMADNGGDWFLCGAPDPAWDDADINTLKTLHGSDFDAIDTSSMDPSINTTPPATPGGLAAAPGANQALLSWHANADSDLLGYRVFQAPAASGPWSEVSSGPVFTPAFTQGGLSGGTTYFFRITAEDDATNQSPPSTVVSVLPSGAATTSASGSGSGNGSAGGSGSTDASAGSASASASGTAGGTVAGTTTTAAGAGGSGGGGGCGLGASMGVITLIALGVRRVAARARGDSPPNRSR